jgi:hypothetical protein
MHSFPAGDETEHGVRRSRWRSWSNLRPWIRQDSTAGKTAGRWSRVAYLSTHLFLNSLNRNATRLLLLRTLSNQNHRCVCVTVCVCVWSVCGLCVCVSVCVCVWSVCLCVCVFCVFCVWSVSGLCVSVCGLCGLCVCVWSVCLCVCVFCVFCVWSVCVCVRYATGMRADVNVINMDELRIHRPEVASDLPSGASRGIQRASGYVLTICKGVVTFRDGVATVRKRLFCAPFCTQRRVFCQDRLGTNMGKVYSR